MSRPLQFLKTTVIGGVLFLIPIIVLVVIVGKALEIARGIVTPLATRIPIESGIIFRSPHLLAVIVVVFFCFLAGLFARTTVAKRMVTWLESTLLVNLPGYAFIKSLGENVVGVEQEHAHQSMLARIDDAWQIAFLVDHIEGGYVAVFVPGAPRPWSGSVYFMTEDRIKPLDVPLTAALQSLQRLGMGANALLRGRL